MIFPAIDLQNGRSVRLYKGDFEKETIINEYRQQVLKEIEGGKNDK